MAGYLWLKLITKIKGVGIKRGKIGSDSKLEAGTLFINSTMGKHSFCGYDCFFNNCEVGSFTSIADRVVVGRPSHPLEWVSTSPVFYNNKDSVKKKYSKYDRASLPRTKIGNDVWIGDNVLIKAGVSVGDGAVIGMGSVVTKDVEPYALVAGSPARHIRYRFPRNIREALIESRWWELSDDKLEDAAKYIREPQTFVDYIFRQS